MLFLGLSTAFGASSYHVTLYKATSVNGTELKPGEYKLEVLDNKVVIKQGKNTVEAPVTVEIGSQKFYATTINYKGESSANELQEIRLSGTNTKLVFGETNPASNKATAGK